MQDINAMIIFARVVETESFTAAAKDLKLSKSAVSKHISGLEDRLKARLLNRTTRRISLTEIGKTYYEYCRRVASDAEEADLAVSNLQESPRGTLKLSLPSSFTIQHIAPLMPAFMAQYPDLKIDMDLDDQVVDIVEEGYDMAIRIAMLPDSSLVARKIATCRVAVCATPEYWDQHGRPCHPKDLIGHNCLQYTYVASGHQWRFTNPKGDREQIKVHISGNTMANNGNALLSLVLGGAGVIMIPTFISGDYILGGELETVLDEWMGNELSIYAIYPQNRHLSAKVRVFIDFLLSQFGENPYWDLPPKAVTYAEK